MKIFKVYTNMLTCKYFTGRLLILTLILFLISCSHRSELKQYEAVKKSIKYKTYKALSEKVIPPLMLSYNFENLINKQKIISEEIVRLLLGYYWAVSGNTTFAFAEANITKEISDDFNFISLAHMLTAICMYEKGWKHIAKGESEKGIDILNKNPDSKYAEIELTGFHFIIGTLCIYENNFEAARFHFAGFAAMTGFYWTYKLVDGMGEIKQGNIKTGLLKIKELSEDNSVPDEIRKFLFDTIAEAEKSTGKIDSASFWPHLVSQVIFEQLKSVKKNSLDTYFQIIEKVKNKVNK